LPTNSKYDSGVRMQSLRGARILILFPHLVIVGGALNYTLRLADQLCAHGAEVAILSLRANRAFKFPEGLEVITLDGPLTSNLGYWLFYPLWQARINRAISSWQPDVLVPQVFPSNWWGWIYKRKHPGTKVVWVCHEPSAFIHSLAWIRAIRPWWKSLLARVLRPLLSIVDVSLAQYCDRIVANSRFTAAAVEQVYGLTPDGVAYPGIDYSSFAGGGSPKEWSIITVARLTEFKRVDFLLEVFSNVLAVHPDLTYHIVGTGEQEVALRALAGQFGLGSRVVFHGTATDLALGELYRRTSLFLHGAIDEPFGMAPLEAIAYGTPVVAHNSGGPTEFVTEECGRLIDSLAVADWASEISSYLHHLRNDPEFPDRVRECARRFDWAVTLQPAVEIIVGTQRQQ
jgi:glycosyltransferase involved in cell wall biosynthesis